MITEIATMRIKPNAASAFQSAFAGTSDIFGRARGWHSAQLLCCVEDPSRYVIKVNWDAVEDHTVAFAQDGLLAEFITAVGRFFDGPPEVLHYEEAGPEIS